jgi:hypothetical protein
MAINLSINSIVGYYNSTASIVGPEPLIETITTLEGLPGVNKPKPRRILDVTTPNSYNFLKNSTATAQTIYLTNQGSADLNIRGINYSKSGVSEVIPIYNTNTWTVIGDPLSKHTATTVILPGQTISFDLAYSSASEGTFTNSFTVLSDGNGSSYIPADVIGTNIVSYKVFTTQEIENRFFFKLSPTSRNTTSTMYGQNTLHRFNIIPYNATTSSYNFSLTGSPGFSIYSSSTSLVRVLFSNNVVNNAAGIYTATLLATAFNGTTSSSATITHTVGVDVSKFMNYGTWLGPGAPTDSIIGMSYDKIDGIRTLTIGLGTGGDGAPSYLQGGIDYLNLANLGIYGSELTQPFRYWAKVYRVPLTEAKTYYSADYKVKSQGTNYDQYFGEEQAPESIFIVENDSFGNVLVKINHLRYLPENDNDLSATLQNITRAFHYYSEADIGGRYYQIGTPTGDGTQTRLFIGFYNNGTTATSLVSYPL